MPGIKDYIELTDKGFELVQNARQIGRLVASDAGVATKEEIVPLRPHAHTPTPIIELAEEESRKTLSYIYYGGFVAVAETTTQESGTKITYKNYSLVRRLFEPDLSPIDKKSPSLRTTQEQALLDGNDLKPLETRFLSQGSMQGFTTEEKQVMRLNFINADNFFTLKDRAWFATRFKLWMGKLADGKNFKGTIAQVSGVPRQDASPTAFEARYHHIFRVWVGQTQGSAPTYMMITEERVVKAPSQSVNNSNFHVVLNEYTSPDLDTWTFSRILAEEEDSNPFTSTYRNYLKVLKPAKYEHVRVFNFSGLTPAQVATRRQTTNLPVAYQRPLLHYFKLVGQVSNLPLRAYLTHALGDRQMYESTDGLSWTKKTVTISGNRQGDVLL